MLRPSDPATKQALLNATEETANDTMDELGRLVSESETWAARCSLFRHNNAARKEKTITFFANFRDVLSESVHNMTEKSFNNSFSYWFRRTCNMHLTIWPNLCVLGEVVRSRNRFHLWLNLPVFSSWFASETFYNFILLLRVVCTCRCSVTILLRTLSKSFLLHFQVSHVRGAINSILLPFSFPHFFQYKM